jgi:hypothetical protein
VFISCAKDAEKALKTCGIAVENPVEMLSESGGEAAEMRPQMLLGDCELNRWIENSYASSSVLFSDDHNILGPSP